jgi:hypothetical protein
MGIYAFSADFLYAELQRDHDDPNSSHDFGKDIIPHIVGRGLAVAVPVAIRVAVLAAVAVTLLPGVGVGRAVPVAVGGGLAVSDVDDALTVAVEPAANP